MEHILVKYRIYLFRKNVQLEICSHEYACLNDECEVISIAETFDGFLNNYSRMTERCVDFICTLALETSCEAVPVSAAH